MTVKELKEKLEEIEKEYEEDFEVLIDAGDLNLLSVSKVYAGSMWNIVIECE